MQILFAMLCNMMKLLLKENIMSVIYFSSVPLQEQP